MPVSLLHLTLGLLKASTYKKKLAFNHTTALY